MGKNRVARLMKVAGIEGVSRRRKTRTTLRGQDSRRLRIWWSETSRSAAPTDCGLQTSRTCRVGQVSSTWPVVVDAFSRRVVGWSLRNDLKTRLVTDALQMALQERESDGVIHHSDQGNAIHVDRVRATLQESRHQTLHGLGR